ncbi:MAG: 4Fe-4S binding protein [Acidobacteria bacterium]|nr:4Fe-4S binding protein [Acidobacteriota bacterium]
MGPTRTTIEIDQDKCDGCGLCLPSCHEGAIQIVEGKARLVEELCDGLGACLGTCPRDAIRVVEVPLGRPAPAAAAVAEPRPAACPGSFPAAPRPAGGPLRLPGIAPAPPFARGAGGPQWPVQIRLVGPQAPFLQGAELVVAADCVPVACRTFHADFADGRAVMIGCPKFDDLDDTARRFAALFRGADVRSVKVVVMEVPCCQSLPMAVMHGLVAAGKDIPIEKIVVGVDGSRLAQADIPRL